MPHPLPLEKLPGRFRVEPDEDVDLAARATDDTAGWSQEDAEAALPALHGRLFDLQELLAADGRRALLLVFQAMDAAGKDSTIRRLSHGLSVSAVRVAAFKAPTEEELRHDFLWRIHRQVPARGQLGIFNRSHYEDVLIVRVRKLAPKRVWKRRYEQINQFERLLADSGVQVVKFMLHISKEYQRQRLLRRLAKPSKHWKFNPEDLEERARWDDYQKAFEEALRRCSPKRAPWYVVPAENRWFRDLLVAQTAVQTLESMELEFPQPTFDPASIVVE